jgi:hypothetical protein
MQIILSHNQPHNPNALSQVPLPETLNKYKYVSLYLAVVFMLIT